MIRNCAKCGLEFEPIATVGRGYCYCKACCSSKRKMDWKNNKDHIREVNRRSHIKTKYGLSYEEYQSLILKQDGKCAICGTKEGTRRSAKSLAIDHCHDTGQIRGLLCQPCNTVLGMFKDDIDLFNKAIKYLQSSENKTQVFRQNSDKGNVG